MRLKTKAFTLAETLIALAIIGIVAALTIPALVQKYQERETISKLKKAYSVISNAYNLTIAENGTPDTWGLSTSQWNEAEDPDWVEPGDSYESRVQIIKKLSKYLKYNKIVLDRAQGEEESDYTIYLNDGTSLSGFFVDYFSHGSNSGPNGSNCTANYGTTKELKQGCANFVIDINGDKKPNKNGIDKFVFYITKNTIIPRGTRHEASWNFEKYCLNKGNNETYEKYRTVACAGWVLENENMDYLRCSDLSWDGKHKCD